MSNRRSYITTAIPYVNGDPHLGFALECVQADVLARHRRLRREQVRFLSGTDDHALKNVEAAPAAGVPVAQFVDAKAEHFAALEGAARALHDDFIRTSRDPRHRPGVERLGGPAPPAAIYERYYEGLYCTGCEGSFTRASSRRAAAPSTAERRSRSPSATGSFASRATRPLLD